MVRKLKLDGATICTLNSSLQRAVCNVLNFISSTVYTLQYWNTLQYSNGIHFINQFLKVMYLILTLKVPLTLPSVFSKTDSAFLKEDTKKCVLSNTCPRAFISQYSLMGVYWLVQAVGHVLCNTHF